MKSEYLFTEAMTFYIKFLEHCSLYLLTLGEVLMGNGIHILNWYHETEIYKNYYTKQCLYLLFLEHSVFSCTYSV